MEKSLVTSHKLLDSPFKLTSDYLWKKEIIDITSQVNCTASIHAPLQCFYYIKEKWKINYFSQKCMDNGSLAEYSHMVQKNTLLDLRQTKQWDLEKKGYKLFEWCNLYVFLAPLHYLPSSKVFFVPCDHIQQRAHKVLYGYFTLSVMSLFKTMWLYSYSG